MTANELRGRQQAISLTTPVLQYRRCWIDRSPGSMHHRDLPAVFTSRFQWYMMPKCDWQTLAPYSLSRSKATPTLFYRSNASNLDHLHSILVSYGFARYSCRLINYSDLRLQDHHVVDDHKHALGTESAIYAWSRWLG